MQLFLNFIITCVCIPFQLLAHNMSLEIMPTLSYGKRPQMYHEGNLKSRKTSGPSQYNELL